MNINQAYLDWHFWEIHQYLVCFLDKSFKWLNSCHWNIKLAGIHVPKWLLNSPTKMWQQLRAVAFSSALITLINTLYSVLIGLVSETLALSPISSSCIWLCPPLPWSSLLTLIPSVLLYPMTFLYGLFPWIPIPCFHLARGSKWTEVILNGEM